MATHLPLNSGNIAHTHSELAEARRPLAQASTLPPFCYTSPEFYAREVEHIFRKEWLSVRFHFCLSPEQFADPQYESHLEMYKQFLDAIHQEDMVACRGIQKGLASPLAQAGRLSHLEKSIWQFNQFILSRVGVGEESAAMKRQEEVRSWRE